MGRSRFVRFDRPVPYTEAVLLQERLVKDRLEDRIPDTLLLLEHRPVITLGRRGRREHLLVDEQALAEAGMDLVVSSRGGDVTWHGPGQWVLYPILKLGPREMGAHGYLHALEEIAIRTAQAFGVEAFRREGKAGAWCAQGKFAATGFKFVRWVTMHGLGLNVRPDLRAFDLIVGCGLVGEPVASLERVLGASCPGMIEAGEEIRRQAETVLGRELWDVHETELG